MKKQKRILHLEKSRVAKLNMLLLRGGDTTNCDGNQQSAGCIPITTPENPCTDTCITCLDSCGCLADDFELVEHKP